MKGSRIVLNNDARGRYEEVEISGSALYPGMFVESVPATADKNGRRVVRAVSRTAGTKGPVCILTEDILQGFNATTVFITGTHALAYWPVAGDELNCLVLDVAGTGDSIALDDAYGLNAVGSLTKDTGSYASTPFRSKEVKVSGSITASVLIPFQFTGDQA